MSKKKIASYDAALKELQQILEQLQGDEVSVDNLSVQVKRAAQLIEYCKTKLRSTEEDLKDVIY